MNSTTSLAALGGDADNYTRREVAEVIAIYSRLYSAQALSFIFYQGRDPLWGAPGVFEGDFVFRPEHLGADYLGRIDLPAPYPGARMLTVTVAIPRRPLPNELRQTDASWVPVWPVRPLYRLSPLLYERIRYQVEMRRKSAAARRHRAASLPRGEGSPLFAVPQPPDTGKRPAILIGMHWLEVGGAEKLGFNTICWALEAGLRVLVVAAVPAIQRLADRLPDHPDVRFLRLDRYLPSPLWPFYLEQLALAENIRLIHIHHCVPLYDALPRIRARLPWVRVIDSTHIVEHADGGFPRISGVWSNFIDLHHVISTELVDYFRDNFHVIGKVRLGRMLERAERQEGLPPPDPSSPDQALPGPSRPPDLPPLNLQPGGPRLHLAFVGRLYYQKRPVVVVEALRALAGWARRRGVELTGEIVGEGPFLEPVRVLLRRYGLSDRVALLPADAVVPEILRRTDILLLPSSNEGLALVCLEALQQGCIPISTDVGSQAEIVPPELLVPLEPRACVKGIAQTVERLWGDAAFTARQRQALAQRWATLAAGRTAHEVLLPLYREAATAAPVGEAG